MEFIDNQRYKKYGMSKIFSEILLIQPLRLQYIRHLNSKNLIIPHSAPGSYLERLPIFPGSTIMVTALQKVQAVFFYVKTS